MVCLCVCVCVCEREMIPKVLETEGSLSVICTAHEKDCQDMTGAKAAQFELKEFEIRE